MFPKLKVLGLLIFVSMTFFVTFCKEKSDTDQPAPGKPTGETETTLPISMFVTSDDLRLEEFGVQDYAVDNSFSINVNAAQSFQTMDGFGYAITGGTALHLNAMNDTKRASLLKELFGASDGELGMSYIRISIGASDLDKTVFSYNDLPEGEVDIEQTQFSLEPDRAVLIPILKEILAINPDTKIMATPWSPPVWMKSNKNSKGGTLLPEYYDSYATYLTRYIQEMEKEGITIHSMSVQNEPLHDGNNPSLYMSAEEQLSFIKMSLGPTFQENNIQTEVLLYDHNADRTDYPMSILEDESAYQYVAGSAFHLYGGSINDLSQVHNAYPEKGIYFTEQWYGAPGNFMEDLKWHIREIVIGASRNWSKNIVEWNLSSTPDLEPHTDGGCDKCLGAITITGDLVARNAGYYVIGHVSQWVPPGSVRIASNYIDELPNVAFLTPENEVVLIVLNNSEINQKVNVEESSNKFSVSLDAGSVATIVWNL